MKRYALRSCLLVLFTTGCGGHGATQFGGPPPAAVVAFGDCALCHRQNAANMAGAAPDLKCEVCHGDRSPGITGPGHRSIPGPAQVPSFVGPSHLLGAEAPFGSCAYCHNQFGVILTPYSADLKCETCHDNRLPGTYGPGHRSLPGPDKVPSPAGPTHQLGAQAALGFCAYCHNQFAADLTPYSADLKCETCHDNRLPGTYGPGHRSFPGLDKVPSPAGPTHQLGAQAALGFCAYCHNQFAVNLTPYSNDLKCETCHDNRLPGTYGPGHRSLPGPDKVPAPVGPTHELGAEAALGYCGFCHNQEAAKLTASGGHGSLVCERCHLNLHVGQFGPGHRSLPACADCHSAQQPHEDPAAGTPSQCFQCHTPHGSSNLFFVREQILTPSGAQRVVEFTNVNGAADGGFASVTPPVRGVCQVCHTTTQFYRADGSGNAHFTFPCYICHLHTNGFLP
jgi:hypothetical protein